MSTQIQNEALDPEAMDEALFLRINLVADILGRALSKSDNGLGGTGSR